MKKEVKVMEIDYFSYLLGTVLVDRLFMRRVGYNFYKLYIYIYIYIYIHIQLQKSSQILPYKYIIIGLIRNRISHFCSADIRDRI